MKVANKTLSIEVVTTAQQSIAVSDKTEVSSARPPACCSCGAPHQKNPASRIDR